MSAAALRRIEARLPLLGGAVAVLLVLAKTTAPRVLATDEGIFRQAMVAMHRGRGYYEAYARALADHHAASSQARGFRLPTMYLAVQWFPPGSYRWLGAAMVLAAVAGCWLLARGSRPAVQALVLVGAGLWLSGLLDATYLYAENWALPFFVAALVAARHRRWTAFAITLGLACAVRELYAPALVAGFFVVPKGHRRALAGTCGALLVLGAVHVHLAGPHLARHGEEAPMDGLQHLGWTLRSLVSPTARPSMILVVAPLTVLGAIGAARCWRVDPAAQVAGATAAALVLLTIYGGRVYWPPMYGPVLVAFLGASPATVGRRPVRDASTTADAPAEAPAEAATAPA